ncbi:MAG TPA: glycosyl hydrolase family 65 protein [Lacipirellulaceae bacterium]|nr:glycosyl hydrolase family 65 protein [Lacipirellulaceae bacterium]
MIYRSLRLVISLLIAAVPSSSLAQFSILDGRDYAHYIEQFNGLDTSQTATLINNERAWQWMLSDVPLLSCPDKDLEETYYFRWWTYRKHIRQTPDGFVITEFLQPVKHAGPHNSISCAFGHHLAEGRWMRVQRPLDEYTTFWFRSGPGGGPAKHFHKYSSWAAAALYNRYLVTLDAAFLVDLLDDLVADYERWESERQRFDGLFWQYDVADGMEESISGSRTAKNIRPTINSYMAANAWAIAEIAALAGRPEIASRYRAKFETLQQNLIESLWDPDAQFFKVRFEDDGLSDVREAIGFIPWMFNLARPEHAMAWRQLKDPAGFWAPRGLTTAERRHPDFRTHGTGTCEWDGAVWPFATSQTLTGLANVLRGPPQEYVDRSDFLAALRTYARSHQKDGHPYIGEYHDEITGEWLITGPKAARSRDYNHSTFCDLVIGGLIGIVPRADGIVQVDPLLPMNEWDWFCLDGVYYHDHVLTIVWDRTGNRYGRGAGFAIWSQGEELARTDALRSLSARLPETTFVQSAD